MHGDGLYVWIVITLVQKPRNRRYPTGTVAEMARMARNMLENSVMVMPGVRVKSAKLNHTPRAVAKRSFFQGLLAKRHTQEMGEWKNVLRGMGKPLS